jgi:pimeloyl-ACP methyl ester carboxylesterase
MPPDEAVAQKNVVLVHGAWADGASWAKIIPQLQAEGYHVVAVQNPLTSLEDDVAATRQAIARLDGPVLLVGHSWGGVVITEAGDDPKVAGLVYVAAWVPDAGQTMQDLARDYPPSPAGAEFRQDVAGFLTITPKGMDTYFVPDLPAGERELVYATQGPWAAKNFATKATKAAWRTKPNWAIVASDDRMIHPDQQRFQAKRINATTIEVKSGHVPMLSQPDKVAAFILQAARKLPARPKPVATGNEGRAVGANH